MSLAFPKHNYVKSRKHLKFIANLPCVICNRSDTQAAHIRHGNKAGMGKKSGDDCTVPICIDHHAKQHTMSEPNFWSDYGGIENATALAKYLYSVTGDNIEAMKMIARWRL